MNAIPPRAERIVRWSLAPWERAAILGDLHEEARAIAAAHGAQAAQRWYWRQTLVSVWPNVWRRVRASLRQPDDLRLAEAWAGPALVSVVTTRPGTFAWTFSALLATFWIAPAFFRRWLDTTRPMTTRGWRFMTAAFAAVLAGAAAHYVSPRQALVASLVWMFWPTRVARPPVNAEAHAQQEEQRG